MGASAIWSDGCVVKSEYLGAMGSSQDGGLSRACEAEVVGLMDTVCPPSTQFAAYNKITSPKALAIYPDFGHEDLPGFTDQTLLFMNEL